MTDKHVQRCVQLRMAGASYQSIAEQLHLSEESVERLVAEGVEALSGESAVTRARLDMARLDSLLLGIWKSAVRGDMEAVSLALKITGQRAGLLAQLAPDHSAGPPRGPIADEIALLKMTVNEDKEGM